MLKERTPLSGELRTENYRHRFKKETDTIKYDIRSAFI